MNTNNKTNEDVFDEMSANADIPRNSTTKGFRPIYGRTSYKNRDFYSENLSRVTSHPSFINMFKPVTLSRIFFTILFIIIGNFLTWFIVLSAILQLLYFIFTAKKNENLDIFIKKYLFEYAMDILAFILFITDDKPFPFYDKRNQSAEMKAQDQQDETENI